MSQRARTEWNEAGEETPQPRYAKETPNQRTRRMQTLNERFPNTNELVHDFGNGWTVQKPTTHGDVYRTGEQMLNCWRNRGSAPRVKLLGGRRRVLVDPNGEPQVAFYHTEPYNFDQVLDPMGKKRIPAGHEYIDQVIGERNHAITPELHSLIQQYAAAQPNPVTWGHVKLKEYPDTIRGQIGEPRNAAETAQLQPSVMYHISPAVNRNQIARLGLTLGGSGRGHVWLFGSLAEAQGLVDKPWGGSPQNDIWEVNTDGLDIISDPHYESNGGFGFQTWASNDPVEAQRLKLIQPAQKTSAATTMYHVAPRSARESIMANGLDWQRGERQDEHHPEGNFLFPKRPSRAWFSPLVGDLWEVNVDGLSLTPDPYGEEGSIYAGAVYANHPIPPQRLRLLSDEHMAKVADYQDGKVMYHVSPVSNRQAILSQGLDPNASQLNPGHEPGVFLWDSPETARRYMGQGPNMYGDFDVHRVNVEGLPMQKDWELEENHPDRANDFPGPHVIREHIPPERIQLHSPNAWFDPFSQTDQAQKLIDIWEKRDLAKTAGARDTFQETPGWGGAHSVPGYVYDWLDQAKPGEQHGFFSDCVNPKCDRSWGDEEQHELTQYGEIRCPGCGTLQNIGGTLGPYDRNVGLPGKTAPGGSTIAGLSMTEMGKLAEKIVTRVGTLPCGQVIETFETPNWPVDMITRDAHSQNWGVEVKAIHSQASPRFKLGDATERAKKILYCQQNNLRQALIGVRLNFYTDQADIWFRPQFTDTYLAADTMQHVGTVDFADLNPYRDPRSGVHNVPLAQEEPLPF